MWREPKSGWKTWSADHLGDSVDPDRSTSPWSGHRDFAYDLIRWRTPDLVVELGTHYGVSFFSFCQAVIDAESVAGTELHAVDTWKGDEHAGFYDESVFTTFKESAKAFPSARVELHRKTFAEALSEFENDSVDLIHIDGFHSYEALKEDYESWLPKLAPNGLMLLHDVSPDSGYGSSRYYAEQIADAVPGFAFPHNFGLGVVFPKGTDGWEMLLSEDFAGWRQFYPYRAEALLLRAVKRDQEKLLDERTASLVATEQMIDERTANLVLAEEALGRNLAELELMQAELRSSNLQLRQAQDRLQQLVPLEASAKAQLKALRHTLPRALKARGRRVFETPSRRLGGGITDRPDDEAGQPQPSDRPAAIETRTSLDKVLSSILGEQTAEERQEAERRLFSGQAVTAEHAARLEGPSRPVPESPEPMSASLVVSDGRDSGGLAELMRGVDADLVTVDIWDTLILRNRPADAAKTATGRRVLLLSVDRLDGSSPDPFDLAALRTEIEAGLAAARSSEEYEVIEVIEVMLDRLGHPESAERSATAQRLAEHEAEDEIRWSYVNAELRALMREMEPPVALLSDFYMKSDLLGTVVSEVTGLDQPLFVSIDKGFSKRLGGEIFRLVRGEYGVAADRHLHVGDNPHADVEQQVRSGGIALQVPRSERFPGPGKFGRENLRECWSELDRQIEEGLPETDDPFRAAGRSLAPMAVGLVSLAVEQAIGAGVDRVHYLSREGAYLKEVHELAEPILRPGPGFETEAVHLEVSRLATFAASLEAPFKDAMHRMWSMYTNQTVAAMLASIGIEPDQVGGHLERAGLTAETHLSDAPRDPRVSTLFDSSAFDRFLADHVERSRELLRDYVTGQTVLTDPFVVVDIGWRGTIQDNLARALDIERSIGAYFGLFPFLNAQAPGTSKFAVAFDGNQGDEFLFAEPPSVLERPWTADIPSTVGYRREDGSVTPIHVKESGAVSEGIRSFQQGTLEATPIVAEWIAGMGLTADLLRPGFEARARRLWANPPSAVADIWFESDHDESFGVLNGIAVHKLGPDANWLQGDLRGHVAEGEKASGWPGGFRAWTSVRGVIELAALWNEENEG